MQEDHSPAQEEESQTFISYQAIFSLSFQGRAHYPEQRERQSPLAQGPWREPGVQITVDLSASSRAGLIRLMVYRGYDFNIKILHRRGRQVKQVRSCSKQNLQLKATTQ